MNNLERQSIANALNAIVEDLARIEHERWSHWQMYMHGKGSRQPDGSLLLSHDLVEHWDRQIRTAYDDLTESEKEGDREQVRRYLPLIVDALSKS
ncbi:hypothetical protein [Caballeronia zhejiangensis]|uniref:Uncharacterized protein n=1 Tax=Caballeronia zhejiangensis TaxID=871203 RepID=A0A656Q800_9BURK|nr:hypothetical protein [Caballeronia zhejiangensis]EKS71737.1 hypothetical protein BURK_007851 [Burkholderia sp. SJ98]KDR24773.1 hypothetical protein BG60_34100 [Caballeronia zhejiangensis]